MKKNLIIPYIGIYDLKKQQYIQASFLYRKRGTLSRVLPKLPILNNVEQHYKKDNQLTVEQAFFAGWKLNHFGHFLLESLSRVSKLPQQKSIVIWLAKSPEEIIFKNWQLEIFSLLGIEHHQHIIVTEPIYVENLILVEPEYRIWDRFTEEHAHFLGCYHSQQSIIPNKKIWLSRSGINILRGGWINEKEIESILIECGWCIYHPELHSVQEQLSELLSAATIAGIEGSAFHTLMLAKQIPNQVIIFARGEHLNPNYQLIASVKKFEQTIHKIPQIYLSGQFSNRIYLVELKTVLNLLNCNIEISHDNNLIQLTRYIERLTKGLFLPKMSYKLLKESAELLENTDLIKAHALMHLAQQLNPTGTVIQAKLIEYQQRLSKMGG